VPVWAINVRQRRQDCALLLLLRWHQLLCWLLLVSWLLL
jgi:hypothetical protein